MFHLRCRSNEETQILGRSNHFEFLPPRQVLDEPGPNGSPDQRVTISTRENKFAFVGFQAQEADRAELVKDGFHYFQEAKFSKGHSNVVGTQPGDTKLSFVDAFLEADGKTVDTYIKKRSTERAPLKNTCHDGEDESVFLIDVREAFAVFVQSFDSIDEPPWGFDGLKTKNMKFGPLRSE